MKEHTDHVGLHEMPVQVGRFRRLHHADFVVSSIEAVADGFARSIGATWNQ